MGTWEPSQVIRFEKTPFEQTPIEANKNDMAVIDVPNSHIKTSQWVAAHTTCHRPVLSSRGPPNFHFETHRESAAVSWEGIAHEASQS